MPNKLSIRILNFTDNVVEEFPDSLIKFRKLTTLLFSKNKISIIPPFLKELEILEHLDISSNQILFIPHIVLEKIRFVSVADNLLKNIDHDISVLYPHITHFLLNKNRHNSFLLLVIFFRLTSLPLLSHPFLLLFECESNMIVDFPYPHYAPKLVSINLAFNELERIVHYIPPSPQISPNTSPILISSPVSLQSSKSNKPSNLDFSPPSASVPCFPSLVQLDLRSNHLKDIPRKVRNLF
jgi:Leucine-rich repeat (LRR) protein